MYRLTLHRKTTRNFYYYSLIIKGKSKKILDKIGYIRHVKNPNNLYIGVNAKKLTYWLVHGLNYKRSNHIYIILSCFLKSSQQLKF